MSAPDGDGAERGAGSPLLRQFAEDTAVASSAAQVGRVWRGSPRPRPARPALFALGLGLGVAILVAFAFIATGQGPTPSAPAQGDLLAPPLAVAPPVPLSAELGAGVHEPVPGLRLTVTGQGRLAGTVSAPRVQWVSGAVRVEVDPAAGIDLHVLAPEGEVAVLGTIFTVDRAPLGLGVQVERGRVAVRCGAQPAATLSAGQAQLCLPTTAAGMLARARALQESSAAGADVLSAVEQGLALGGSAAVQAELRVVEYEERVKANDLEGALAALDAYLAQGGPRHDELRSAAAGLAVRLGGCARARAYLPVPAPEPAVAACGR